MKNEAIRHYLTIYAAAFIFLVFGIWEIVNPQYWNSFVPAFVSNFFSSVNLLVQVHGIILTLIGSFLILDFKRKIAAALGTLVMLDIVFSLLFESGFSSLLIRDTVITIFVLSLFFDDYKKEK